MEGGVGEEVGEGGGNPPESAAELIGLRGHSHPVVFNRDQIESKRLYKRATCWQWGKRARIKTNDVDVRIVSFCFVVPGCRPKAHRLRVT